MSSHYREVCEYGTVHSQCRCMIADKVIKHVDCPVPGRCSVKAGVAAYIPRHRADVESED